MISQRDIKKYNLSREDVIGLIMQATGKSSAAAEVIYAIETGESDGDVVPLNKNGEPVKE